jgi:hypothetical protein
MGIAFVVIPLSNARIAENAKLFIIILRRMRPIRKKYKVYYEKEVAEVSPR